MFQWLSDYINDALGRYNAKASQSLADKGTGIATDNGTEPTNIIEIYIGSDTELGLSAYGLTHNELINCQTWAEMMIQGNVSNAAVQIQLFTSSIPNRERIFSRVVDCMNAYKGVDTSSSKYASDLAELKSLLGVNDERKSFTAITPRKSDLMEVRPNVLDLPRRLTQEEAKSILEVDTDNRYFDQVRNPSGNPSFTVTRNFLAENLGENFLARLEFSRIAHEVKELAFNGNKTPMVAMDRDALEKISQGISTRQGGATKS